MGNLYNQFKMINSDNPLELARKIVAPLCKEKLNQHILNCNDCNTCNGCLKKIAIGNPDANILIINDSTNNKEMDDYLIALLETAGIDINDTFIINSISCILERKLDDKSILRLPTKKEVKNCKHFVDYAIEFVKPRIIICMGATSLTMYDNSVSMESINGQYININGIKTMVTNSVRDLFSMAEYVSEEEVDEKANNILNHLYNAKQYLNNLKRG